MNLCKLIGHKVKFYDGPYPICERCGSHAYYDNYDFYFAWHYWPYRLFFHIVYLPSTIKRWWKYRKPMNEDDIPF